MHGDDQLLIQPIVQLRQSQAPRACNAPDKSRPISPESAIACRSSVWPRLDQASRVQKRGHYSIGTQIG
jgi:hypothetical protein